MIKYETQRLFLKVLEETDSEKVLDYLIHNKDFFSQFEPERDQNFYTIDFQRTQLRNDFNFIKNKSMLRLWIFKKDNPNKVIGEVTFYNIFPFVFSSCHIGYKSDKDEINKGIITEAVKKGIEIMFNEYGIHRIEAHVLPENKASLRVLAKLGFINEGIAHKFLEVNGVWEDHIHLACINELSPLNS